MDKTLSPIRQSSKVCAAQDAIRGHIEQGCRAGDKIPSVRNLEKQLKVSRMTIVSALSGLVSEGLIRAEHGRGYFVLEKQNRALAEQATIGVLYMGGLEKGDDLGVEYKIFSYISGVQSFCGQSNFRLLPYARWRLFETYSPEDLSSFDALMVCGGDAETYGPALGQLRPPVVILGGTPGVAKTVGASAAVYNDTEVARDLIFQHLHAMRHVRVGMVTYGGETEIAASYEKIFGCPLLPEDVLGIWDENRTPRFERIDTWIRNGLEATAYLLADEFITARFVGACQQNHISIPDDISIATLYYPPGMVNTGGLAITGVDSLSLSREMGHAAGAILLDLLSGKKLEQREVRIQPRLQTGNSVAAPPR